MVDGDEDAGRVSVKDVPWTYILVLGCFGDPGFPVSLPLPPIPAA